MVESKVKKLGKNNNFLQHLLTQIFRKNQQKWRHSHFPRWLPEASWSSSEFSVLDTAHDPLSLSAKISNRLNNECMYIFAHKYDSGVSQDVF